MPARKLITPKLELESSSSRADRAKARSSLSKRSARRISIPSPVRKQASTKVGKTVSSKRPARAAAKIKLPSRLVAPPTAKITKAHLDTTRQSPGTVRASRRSQAASQPRGRPPTGRARQHNVEQSSVPNKTTSTRADISPLRTPKEEPLQKLDKVSQQTHGLWIKNEVDGRVRELERELHELRSAKDDCELQLGELTHKLDTAQRDVVRLAALNAHLSKQEVALKRNGEYTAQLKACLSHLLKIGVPKLMCGEVIIAVGLLLGRVVVGDETDNNTTPLRTMQLADDCVICG